MTNKLMLINTDTHVVVPRELHEAMRQSAHKLEDKFQEGEWPSVSEYWETLIKAVPPLTTPPVLRWEGEDLMFYDAKVAWLTEYSNGYQYQTINDCDGFSSQEQEARRAAEKALGFPEGLIIPEV